jgi:phosphoglycerate dehydrogenase-like enzyme
MGIILVATNPSGVDEERRRRLEERANGRGVLVSDNEREIEAHLDEVEIAFGESARRFLNRAKKLRWYQQSGAGADWILDDPKPGAYILTNASGVHGVPITEHIMAFLLCFARGFKASILGQAGRVWEKNRRQPVFELEGKRVLLIGVGAIGRRFATVAEAFGMEVIGVRRSSGAEEIAGTVKTVRIADIDSELPWADIVVVTAPLTEETRHMFDLRRLRLMKRGSYIVNIGRGPVIKEEDLITVLEEGHIAGAGLDVFETEPLPESSPLWDLENVILTPHYSGLTPRYQERLWEIFLDNLERYNRGERLRNVVDRSRGY